MIIIPPGTGIAYITTEWDGDLDKIAARFGTAAKRIHELSLKKEEYRSMTFIDFWTAMKGTAGKLVYVPLPLEERSWQFESFTPKEGQTLQRLCDAKNADKRRTGMPKLVASYVWSHVMNARFRQHHLVHQDLKRDDIDKDPSQQEVRKDSPDIWLPYPIPDDGGHIAVKPVMDQIAAMPQPKAVVVVKPDWISDLIFRLNQIDERANRLNQIEVECSRLRQSCAFRVGRLSAIVDLLDLIDKESLTGSNVKDLRQNLNSFQAMAMEIMTINPARVMELSSDQQRLDLSTQLLNDLRWDGLKKLVDKALGNPTPVDGTPLINRISRSLESAYSALVDGYQAHEQHKDLEAAIDVVGQAKAGLPPAAATTALASVMSFVGTEQERPPELSAGERVNPIKIAGTTAQIASPLIGNLPGPASLAVAVTKWLGYRYCVFELGDPARSREKYKKLYRVIELALRFTAEEKALMKEVFDAADELTSVAGKLEGTGLGDWLKLPKQEAHLEKIKTNTDKITESLANRIHKSFGWRSTILGLSAFGMYFTITQPDELKLRLAANFIGGGVSGAVAAFDVAAKVLEFLGNKEWAATIDDFLAHRSVGAFFGAVGAVVAILAGGVTALDGYHNNRNKDIVAGVAQAVGGAALLVAATAVAMKFAPYSANVLIPEVIAGLSLAVSAVASNWDEIKKLPWPGTKKLTKYHFDDFEKSPEYRQLSSKSSDLKHAWDAVTRAFEAASFADFDSLDRSRVEQELSKRFGNDIDFMFATYWRPVTAWEGVPM